MGPTFIVSVLLTNLGGPLSATTKMTRNGSDLENLSLFGKPRAPTVRIAVMLPYSLQVGKNSLILWSPQSPPVCLYHAQSSTISDLCLPCVSHNKEFPPSPFIIKIQHIPYFSFQNRLECIIFVLSLGLNKVSASAGSYAT